MCGWSSIWNLQGEELELAGANTVFVDKSTGQETAENGSKIVDGDLFLVLVYGLVVEMEL